jgi:hypothetical protein
LHSWPNHRWAMCSLAMYILLVYFVYFVFNIDALYCTRYWFIDLLMYFLAQYAFRARTTQFIITYNSWWWHLASQNSTHAKPADKKVLACIFNQQLSGNHTFTVLVSSAVVQYDTTHRKTSFWLHWAFKYVKWNMVYLEPLYTTLHWLHRIGPGEILSKERSWFKFLFKRCLPNDLWR